jgi:hypothetical protein
MAASSVTFDEQRRFDLQPHALVVQAFELRETGYVYDAVEAIVEHWHRMPLTLLEQRQEEKGRVQRLLKLLSETNPDFAGVEPQFLDGSEVAA